jgi:Nif-specific regulatory protein
MAQDEVISDLAFPCQGNRCLTQVLHHIDREDAVRPGRLASIPIAEVPGAPPRAPAEEPVAAHAEPWPDTGPAAVGAASEASEQAASDGKPEGEHDRLVWAMERCGWVQAKAARLLKISPRQMGYALRKYGIEVRKF